MAPRVASPFHEFAFFDLRSSSCLLGKKTRWETWTTRLRITPAQRTYSAIITASSFGTFGILYYANFQNTSGLNDYGLFCFLFWRRAEHATVCQIATSACRHHTPVHSCILLTGPNRHIPEFRWQTGTMAPHINVVTIGQHDFGCRDTQRTQSTGLFLISATLSLRQ